MGPSAAGVRVALKASYKAKSKVKAKPKPRAKAYKKPSAKSSGSGGAPTPQPSSTGRIERPLLRTIASAGLVSYASDCTGLDAGAMALRNILPQFKHQWVSEVEPAYMKVLQATHPDVNMYFGDVTLRSDEDLDPFANSVTIYTSGFPCTVFSQGGNQKGMSDPNIGLLSFYIVLTICKVLPDMFILENVPEFALDQRHHHQFDLTLRMLRNAHDGLYNIYWKVLNSKSHGSPAQRRRLYIVGLRRDKTQLGWVWPAERPAVELRSILDPATPILAQHDADLASLPPFALNNLAHGLEKVNEMIDTDPSTKAGPWVVDIGVSKSRRKSCNPTFNSMPTITKCRAKGRHYYISGRGLMSEIELMRCQGFDPKRIVVPHGGAPRPSLGDGGQRYDGVGHGRAY